MSNYWKLWGGVIGAALALGVEYALIPVGVHNAFPMFWDNLWPLIGAWTGTVLSPKNAG